MKNKTYLIIGSIIILLLTFFLGRCTAPSPSQDHTSDFTLHTSSFTCSMHPQIQQAEPGDCPICGMDLILVENKHDSDDGPRTLSMSESSRALADIQTSAIERRFPEATIRLLGKLEYDETKIKSLTARFPARIDNLFVNFTGVPVKKGDTLAEVYSPELLTAQSELLSAHRYDPNSSATHAATEKLRLWDLLPEQIENILKSGQAKDSFELKAPISGVVIHKSVNEGDYIKTGQQLFKIVDLNKLWLQLDAYESDLVWLRFGQAVTFTVESYPGENFEGKITFIDPELNRKTRTIAIRVDVPNQDRKLKPGMFAKAIVRSKIAQSGNVYAPEFAGKWISPMHPEIIKDAPGQCDVCNMDLVPAEELGYIQDLNAEMPLVIPTSAVLRTGKRSVVYLEIHGTEQPKFEGREIEIGPRADDVFIVVSGLELGDRVVTNGAFKIDSALQIQAKPSMMNPQSGGPPPEHNHSANEPMDHSQPQSSTVLTIEIPSAQKILPYYFQLQTALSEDNLDNAKNALREMMSATGHSGPLPELIHTMLNANTLHALRRPHFETMSNALIATVSESPETFQGNVYQMNCPMVYPDRGADWLQNHDQLLNPYFGATMLHCGETKKQF